MTRVKVHKGLALFNFGILFYLFMDSIGGVSQSAGNIVGIIFLCGFLTMFSQVCGEALQRGSVFLRKWWSQRADTSEVDG